MSLRFNQGVAIRIARTAAMTFIGAYGASHLVNVLGGSETFDVSLAKAAGATALVAVVSAIWNIVLDPSPVPSLDPEKKAA